MNVPTNKRIIMSRIIFVFVLFQILSSMSWNRTILLCESFTFHQTSPLNRSYQQSIRTSTSHNSFRQQLSILNLIGTTTITNRIQQRNHQIVVYQPTSSLESSLKANNNNNSGDEEDTKKSKTDVTVDLGTTKSSSSSSSSVQQSSSDSTTTNSVTNNNNNNKKNRDDSINAGGMTRTLLLAFPLFCKFAIVLMIKFLTDLVVFPLLFLYRGCRLFKRKVLGIFGIKVVKPKKIKKNGKEMSTSNGGGGDSLNDDNTNGEGGGFSSDYKPNGAQI